MRGRKKKTTRNAKDRLKKEEASSRFSKNLLVLKWADKKEIYMISTIHTADFARVISLQTWREKDCAKACMCHRL
jgi:hypothetical protein